MNKRAFATAIPKLGRSRSQKIRELRRVRGIPPRVDSAPITEHVAWLHSIGFSDFALAAAAGVSQVAVHQVRTGKFPRTGIDRAARLRALTHIPVPDQHGTLVPSAGTVRRLRALQAAGFTFRKLGAELGCHSSAVSAWARSTQVRQETWQNVAELYERLSGSVGDAPRVSSKWLLPMEWDGYDIDDPRVKPPRSRQGSRITRNGDAIHDRRAEVARLTRAGLSAGTIGERLGISARQVVRDRAASIDGEMP